MLLLDNNYIKTSGSGSTWIVEITGPSRPVSSYYDETVLAAEKSLSQRTSPLYLCYSGGLDSEYVLNVFLQLGMNIQPVIMNTQYNHPETKYAFKLCNEKNIKPIIIDLDYDKFIESGKFIELATKTKCSAYQYIANMWLTSQIDGTVITGDSDPHLFLNTSTRSNCSTDFVKSALEIAGNTSGVNERRLCLAASFTIVCQRSRPFSSFRPIQRLTERSACHGTTCITPSSVAAWIASSSRSPLASACTSVI